MKKYAAIISATHSTKEVVTISADSHDKAFRLAGELADELVEEGSFDEDDSIDIDMFDLDDVSHICDKNHPDDDGEAACVKALAELIRFSRNTDSEFPDRVLARLFLDGMRACGED